MQVSREVNQLLIEHLTMFLEKHVLNQNEDEMKISRKSIKTIYLIENRTRTIHSVYINSLRIRLLSFFFLF